MNNLQIINDMAAIRDGEGFVILDRQASVSDDCGGPPQGVVFLL